MSIWIKAVEPKWLAYVSSRLDFDEVNLWNASDRRSFEGAEAGDLVLFRVAGQKGRVAGYGYFFNSAIFWASDAWDIFGERNGAPNRERFIEMVAAQRAARDLKLYAVACHDIVEPVYFHGLRKRLPEEVLRRLGPGPVDEDSDDGRLLLAFVQDAPTSLIAVTREIEMPIHAGASRPVTPGRSGFRVEAIAAYDCTCAITGETVLPCLEAVHLVANRLGGPMAIWNALLLRRDLHPLIEQGYMAISENHLVMVSAWLARAYPESKAYQAYDGTALRLPRESRLWPDPELLARHRSLFIG